MTYCTGHNSSTQQSDVAADAQPVNTNQLWKIFDIGEVAGVT